MAKISSLAPHPSKGGSCVKLSPRLITAGNPFGANVPRKLTKDELIQAVRLNIAGELEAIYVYDAHIQATDDIVAKKVIGDIRDEEKAHIGELLTLLKYLDPKEAEFLAEGEEEVKEMLEELNIKPSDASSKDASSTVGSLLKE